MPYSPYAKLTSEQIAKLEEYEWLVRANGPNNADKFKAHALRAEDRFLCAAAMQEDMPKYDGTCKRCPTCVRLILTPLAISKDSGKSLLSKPVIEVAQLWRKPFLEIYAKNGNIRKSSDLMGIGSMTVRVAMKRDPEFREQVNLAYQDYADTIEEEARRRAVDGIPRNKYFRDQLLETETEYSDRLLEMLLKGAKPERYRDRVDVSGKIETTIDPKQIDERLMEIFAAAAERKRDAEANAERPVIEAELVRK